MSSPLAWRNDPTKIVRKEIPSSFKATVPGCIHTDLIDAGFIDDISINGKEQDQFWIWKTDSSYTATIPHNNSDGNKHLVFMGLDTISTISINGVVKLTTKNMHRSYRLDITDESLRFVLNNTPPEQQSIALAKLVLERQKKRMETKLKYKQAPIEDEEWRSW